VLAELFWAIAAKPSANLSGGAFFAAREETRRWNRKSELECVQIRVGHEYPDDPVNRRTNLAMLIPLLPSRLLHSMLVGSLLLGCSSSSITNRDPVGEAFPTVQGESLDREAIELPTALAGEPAILLVGYLQEAQFDADRWLFGLLQAGTPARIREVPTIPGLVPSAISSTIDNGMRAGIPSEDWGSVVTIYGSDAGKIRAMTGDENGRNMRVILLDRDGQVRWFHDRGFSAGQLIALDKAAREL